ncbi:hypothetical protein BDZ91DRAFT_719088 [Kalaharituber pfeilii]|nr:hypothetical protein BDZ91DRAFT_719088 [Kalaharituber pfeilii]
MQLSMNLAVSLLLSIFTAPLTTTALPTSLDTRDLANVKSTMVERHHHHTPRFHHVQVGGANILAYTPAYVFAVPGDIVRFEFLQLNHTVTQSSFLEPCTALEGGVESGFRFNPQGIRGKEVFDFEIPAGQTGPMWFYCRQGRHCSSAGMVFAINPNVDADFTTFFARARGLIP